jgi:hypothetical protein
MIPAQIGSDGIAKNKQADENFTTKLKQQESFLAISRTHTIKKFDDSSP